MRAAVHCLCVAGIVAAVVVSSDALAFKCSRVAADTGPSLVWNDRAIEWYANPNVFDLLGDVAISEEELRGAFAAWEEVDCSDMTLPYQGTKIGARAEYIEKSVNNNVVVAVNSGWSYDNGAIAVTTSAYDTRTGQVVDADIEINAQNFNFSRVDSRCRSAMGTMDLRNTLTHEVGHVVGLEHPPNTVRYEETTMFASAPPCETKKRTLEQDDRDGICAIYPAGLPTEQCFPPEGPSFIVVDADDGFGGCSHQRGRPGGFVWILSMAFLALAFRRHSV